MQRPCIGDLRESREVSNVAETLFWKVGSAGSRGRQMTRVEQFIVQVALSSEERILGGGRYGTCFLFLCSEPGPLHRPWSRVRVCPVGEGIVEVR